MSFAISLSGLNGASADLEVTANNVANVNTTGFKSSRAQFAEVFAVGTQSVSTSAAGSGVRLSSIAQQFTQGNIDFTDNALDLAIGGEGFFVINDNGARSYTRAGAFGVDRDGYVTNAQGQRLQAYPYAGNNLFNTGTPQDLQLTIGSNPPAATTRAAFGINLPADAALPANPVFDPLDPIRLVPRTRRPCISSRTPRRMSGTLRSRSTAHRTLVLSRSLSTRTAL